MLTVHYTDYLITVAGECVRVFVEFTGTMWLTHSTRFGFNVGELKTNDWHDGDQTKSRQRFMRMPNKINTRLMARPTKIKTFSDSASSRSCSIGLRLIQTFTSDSHSRLLSLHLCGPSLIDII